MPPGQASETTFTFPAKQLIAAEFEVYGVVETEKLFQFNTTSGLSANVVVPLQEEFVSQLESIGIKSLVNGALAAVGALNPGMSLAQVAQLREAFIGLSNNIDDKSKALDDVYREFHLNRESTLGQRTREIALGLIDFKRKVVELDQAIGNTDLQLIDTAVSELKQIQLAVLRVEDTIRAMASAE